MTEHPHRRVGDDYVTWRDISELREWIVTFVSDSEAKWHTVRAESLSLIGLTLEKMDSRLEKVDERMDVHDTYHRTVLQEALQAMSDARANDATNAQTVAQFGKNYRLGMWTLALATVAFIVGTAVTLFTR